MAYCLSRIDRGYFEVKEKPITMGETTINYAQTYVTAKGVDYLGWQKKKNGNTWNHYCHECKEDKP